MCGLIFAGATNKYEDEIMDAKNAIHEHGVVLEKNIAIMNEQRIV